MTGPEKLRRFIDRAGLTQEQFAVLAKVPGPQVSMWLSGRRKPNLESAAKLQAATSGAVQWTDWIVSKRRRAA